MALVVAVSILMGLLSLADGATTLGNAVSGTTMRQLLNSVGLLDTLNSGGPYTLFIPSDLYLRRYLASEGTSVSELQRDPSALKLFLLYHVVNGTIPRNQLFNERILTSLNGDVIRVNDYEGKLTVQGVPLQSRDTTASNGIIHYLYAPMEPSDGTVMDVIRNQPDLSTFLTAVNAADLGEFFEDQNPITVFAPSNAAFSALGDKVTALLENPPLLAEILRYHVVPGTLYTTGISQAAGRYLHTYEEADRIHLVNQFRGITVEDAHVLRRGVDLSATNGVIHELDSVLIPESLKSQI